MSTTTRTARPSSRRGGPWLLHLLLAVALLAPSRLLYATGHGWWLLASLPATVFVFFVIVGILGRPRR